MLDILILLQKKLPPGFILSIKRQVVGFEVKFQFGRIESTIHVDDNMLEDDFKPETRQLFGEIILEDQVKKIREHPQFRLQKP